MSLQKIDAAQRELDTFRAMRATFKQLLEEGERELEALRDGDIQLDIKPHKPEDSSKAINAARRAFDAARSARETRTRQFCSRVQRELPVVHHLYAVAAEHARQQKARVVELGEAVSHMEEMALVRIDNLHESLGKEADETNALLDRTPKHLWGHELGMDIVDHPITAAAGGDGGGSAADGFAPASGRVPKEICGHRSRRARGRDVLEVQVLLSNGEQQWVTRSSLASDPVLKQLLDKYLDSVDFGGHEA